MRGETWMVGVVEIEDDETTSKKKLSVSMRTQKYPSATKKVSKFLKKTRMPFVSSVT